MSFSRNRNRQANRWSKEEDWNENPVLHHCDRGIKKTIGVIKGLLSGISRPTVHAANIQTFLRPARFSIEKKHVFKTINRNYY